MVYIYICVCVNKTIYTYRRRINDNTYVYLIYIYICLYLYVASCCRISLIYHMCWYTILWTYVYLYALTIGHQPLVPPAAIWGWQQLCLASVLWSEEDGPLPRVWFGGLSRLMVSLTSQNAKHTHYSTITIFSRWDWCCHMLSSCHCSIFALWLIPSRIIACIPGNHHMHPDKAMKPRRLSKALEPRTERQHTFETQ